MWRVSMWPRERRRTKSPAPSFSKTCRPYLAAQASASIVRGYMSFIKILTHSWSFKYSPASTISFNQRSLSSPGMQTSRIPARNELEPLFETFPLSTITTFSAKSLALIPAHKPDMPPPTTSTSASTLTSFILFPIFPSSLIYLYAFGTGNLSQHFQGIFHVTIIDDVFQIHFLGYVLMIVVPILLVFDTLPDN